MTRMEEKLNISNILKCKTRFLYEKDLVNEYLLKNFNSIIDPERLLECIPEKKLNEIINHSLLHKNQIITIDNGKTIAIIKNIIGDKVILGATYSKNSNKIYHSQQRVITVYEAIQDSDENDMIQLQRAFNENGVVWDHHLGKVISKHTVKINQYVKVSLLGHVLGFGIFREINKDNELILYVYKEEGKPLRCSLYENIGHIDSFQIELLNHTDQLKLKEELYIVGKLWNGHKARLEPLKLQVKKKHIYYHLSDTYEIIAKIENGSWQDVKLYNSGNYFVHRENAKEFGEFLKSTSDRMNAATNRASKGESFYYIDQYWTIQKKNETIFTKNEKLFTVNNYFSDSEAAKMLLDLQLEERKRQLINLYPSI